MYCKRCGGQNEDGATFCVTCGATLDKATAQPDTQTSESNEPTVKQRHGCLTAYLIVMIVLSSIAIVTIPMINALSEYMKQAYPDYTATLNWQTWVSLVLSIAQIALAVAIFKWKRWAVYGFIAANVIQSIVVISDTGSLTSLTDMAAFASVVTVVFTMVRYALIIGLFVVALRMGRPSGWKQMD